MTDEEEFDDECTDEVFRTDCPGRVEVGLGDPDLDSMQSASAAKYKKIDVNWVQRPSYSKFYSKILINYENLNKVEVIEQQLGGKSPKDIFDKMTEGLFEMLSVESNLYAAQNNHFLNATPEDYQTFIGVLLLSGYRPVPRQRMYWSSDDDVGCDLIRNAIPRNRFYSLKRYLHFNDNDKINENCRDRLFKIRPVIDLFNRNFQLFNFFSAKYSVDEKMVRYYGRHGLKQFIHGKPIRFGFKEWALCCSETGYTYKFNVYQGASDRPKDTPLGVSVVEEMTNGLPEGSEVFFDNFFTNHSLMVLLKEKNIKATGTLRSNRISKDAFTSPEDFKRKKDRGYYEMVVDEVNGICGVRWKDNNVLSCLSNAYGCVPTTRVKRRIGQERKDVDVPCMIAEYNKGMGGVDMSDWKTERYRTMIRGKKWYFVIFSHCIDVAVVNTTVLYNMANPSSKLDLLDVRRYITKCLLQPHAKAIPRRVSSKISDEIRKSGDHVIERTEGKSTWHNK